MRWKWSNFTQKQKFEMLRKYRISKTYAYQLSQIKDVSKLPSFIKETRPLFWDFKKREGGHISWE